MMNAALAGTDPVVFFESQKIYDYGEKFVEEGVPEGYYEIDRANRPSSGRQGCHHRHVWARALHRDCGCRRTEHPGPLRRGHRSEERESAGL